MEDIYKFGQPDGEVFTWPNIYCRERTRGPNRLAIAPRSEHMELMLDLTAIMPEPFNLLYVLMMSRPGRQAGRYQTPSPIGRDAMEQFLLDFRRFFELDGRHHIWVMSTHADDQVIYDQHNVLYAYGQLDQFEDIVVSWGLREEEVEFPQPHTHLRHPQLDSEEQRLFARYAWQRFPLETEDQD